MSATVLDPSPIAAQYLAEVRRDVARLTGVARPPRIVGLLGQRKGPAATYARYASRGCESVGIDLDVRHVDADQVEAAIAAANVDPEVDGIFIYYPVMDVGDRWLRELVDPRKDVEGLHSFWSRLLYENRRFLDPERTVRAILPCTPLAILKLLDHAGMRGANVGRVNAPLEGLTACVINRSELVGRPLAAMLANDGARVHSLDITGVDVAEYTNFDKSVLEHASVFVPRVGPLTIAMASDSLRSTVPSPPSLGRAATAETPKIVTLGLVPEMVGPGWLQGAVR